MIACDFVCQNVMPFSVGGWYIAMVQYSSLSKGAVVTSLDAVDIGEEVLVRIQVG